MVLYVVIFIHALQHIDTAINSQSSLQPHTCEIISVARVYLHELLTSRLQPEYSTTRLLC